MFGTLNVNYNMNDNFYCWEQMFCNGIIKPINEFGCEL